MTEQHLRHKHLWRLAPNRGNALLWMLLLIAPLLLLAHPLRPAAVAALIDWDTVGALAGLLLLTKGIERSGALQAAARRLLAHITGLRGLALALTALSAALAAVVTNDVCLFLLVPLTRALAGQARLPLARLVAFEALAVNAGSALTPIGNPQNLFLWQRSGLDFTAFVTMMAPAVAIMLGLLLLAVWLLVPSSPITLRQEQTDEPSSPRLLWTAAGLFVPFVLALNFHHLLPALLLVVAVFLFAYPRMLLAVDWTLLPIIGLMFVDMRLLAAQPAISAWLGALPIGQGLYAYVAAAGASQLVSNVPAAILLAPYVHDLPALAAGVSVGGFGLATGSLANLIALRLSAAPGGAAALHRLSIPFLLACGAAVALLHLA